MLSPLDRFAAASLTALCALAASAAAQTPSPADRIDRMFPTEPAPLPDWLQDNLRRRDPAQDGWPTEAACERMQPVLDAFVAALIAEPPKPEAVGALLAEGFTGATALRPAELKVLFDDGNVVVRRPKSIAAARSGPDALPQLAQEMCKPFAGSQSRRATAWITAIEQAADQSWRTHVMLRIGADLGGKRVAQNAEWNVEWGVAGDKQRPGLRSIELTSFEEVAVLRPMFGEISRYVFGNHPWFDSQFQYGLDNYYFHCDRLTGNHLLGLQGVAIGDLTGDGYDDVYVPMQGGLPNRLFVHDPDGTTKDRAADWGVALLDNTRSALIVDLDNDGRQDLALASGPNVLVCFNNGKGAFDPMNWLEGDSPEDVYSLSAGDADNDGDLDLYACRYVVSGMMGGVPLPYYDANNGATNYFWRNQGERKFVNATAEAGFDQNGQRYSLTSLWDDLDDDGDPDLLVANDFGRKNLFLNDGGRFRDAADQLGLGEFAASMGITCADADQDGDLDLYISNMWSAPGQRIVEQKQRFQDGKYPALLPAYAHHAAGNTLLVQESGGRWRDATAEAGVARGGWAWGAMFADFQNDGLPDIYVPDGFTTMESAFDVEDFFWRRVIGQSPPDATPSEPYRQAWASIQHMVMLDRASYNGRERNVAYVNLGGLRFADVSAASGMDFPDDGRSVALTDWDDDGRIDLVIKSRTGPRLRMLRNESPVAGNFLSVDLAGTRCNRDAIGARVTLELEGRKLVRTLYAGEGCLAQSTKRLLFGLGKAERVKRLTVRWPDSSQQSFDDLPVNERFRIVQDAAAPERVAPRRSAPVASAPLETLQRDPRMVRRIVLVEKLPIGELEIPAFDRADRQIKDYAGENLLVSFWTSRGSRANFENLVAHEEELKSWGVRPLFVSVDEGAALAKARKMVAGTSLGGEAGYADGSCLQALSVLFHEIFDRSDLVPLPVSMLVDSQGQIVALYEGDVDFIELMRDLKALKTMDVKNLGTSKLSGGRWANRPARDFKRLGEIFGQLGHFKLAAFYKTLATERAAETPAPRER